MEEDISKMSTKEIEEMISQLEENYETALKNHADIHGLSKIWVRIKELKTELNNR
ncbi:MAG TPA: hypothetical protein VFQ73_11175 [Flavisolibacter sp.]|nr:hypothetical protein [Flavisolibacter sp.]